MKLRFAAILLAGLAFTMVSSRAFAQKVQVCHKTGNGSFHLISIDINALSTHTDHGDEKPGDPIPNDPGFIFGPTGSVVDLINLFPSEPGFWLCVGPSSGPA